MFELWTTQRYFKIKVFRIPFWIWILNVKTWFCEFSSLHVLPLFVCCVERLSRVWRRACNFYHIHFVCLMTYRHMSYVFLGIGIVQIQNTNTDYRTDTDAKQSKIHTENWDWETISSLHEHVHVHCTSLKPYPFLFLVLGMSVYMYTVQKHKYPLTLHIHVHKILRSQQMSVSCVLSVLCHKYKYLITEITSSEFKAK